MRNLSIIGVAIVALGATVLHGQERTAGTAELVAAPPRPLTDSPVTGPARGWSRSDGAPLDGVTVHGPATRVTPVTDLSLSKSEYMLSGSFSVSATFQHSTQSSASAPYGLSLGTTNQRSAVMLFLTRSDSAWSIQRPGSAPMWTPSSETERATTHRLAVRLQGQTVEFWVNGSQVGSVKVAAGELDGQPGVHVGAQADVMVSMFTVTGPRELFVK